MRVLITGAAGFIGSHLAQACVAAGYHTTALDNLSTGYRHNIERVRGALRFVEGDILDAETLAEAMAGCEVVLHQAAVPSVPRSVADPLRSHEANVTGTLRVFLAARAAGVRRVVFASSSSVYGPCAPVPTPETAPRDPASPYAATKAMGEQYAEIFTQLYGDVDLVGLRYFNVFGPRQDPHSAYAAVIPRFITRLMAGEAPEVHGDGTQCRDFTYVENVVGANLAAAQAPGAIAGMYNIACGQPASLRDLLAILGRQLGVTPAPVFTEARAGDIPRSHADIARARAAFGYAPRIDLETGLEQTVHALQRSMA